MTYKPELDGLRAVAVLLVLLCHMQLGMSGGFVGVDVFFVISGFLITSIVVGSLSNGRFSFWNFYGRRFVRLYPALITVTLLTFLVAFVLADPVTLANMARTGKYALASASNIFFSKHQGYFDFGADKQLFLHTWSLGVEWQFYLIWPVLVWAVFKLPAKFTRIALITLLALITLASLAASQVMISTHAVNAYYLMPYRAFELGIGALLVFVYDRQINPAASVALMIAGIAAIVYSACVYTPATPFPGLAALLPCLGAAACMYAGKGFAAGNVLRWAPVVYIGKISYSVYLVHWPLLLFYRYYVFREINTIEKIILLLASLLLGALIYHLIEQKINWKGLKNKLHGCIAMLAVVCAIVAGFQYTSKSDGLPWRLGAQQNLYSEDYVEGGTPGNFSVTHFGDPQGRRIAYLLGDSFSAHYYVGFNAALSPRNEYIDAIFNFGCFMSDAYPMLGTPSALRQTCVDLYHKAVSEVNTQHLPLILAQDWLLYYSHEPIDHRESNRFANEAAFYDFLVMHLQSIQNDIGDNPLVILSLPNYYRYHFNIAECLTRPPWLPQVCDRQAYAPYAAKDALSGRINARLKAYADTHENAYFIDVTPTVCPDGICRLEDDIKIYNDGRHFSRYGSRLAATDVIQALDQIISRQAATAAAVPVQTDR
jgi:peptidoglycan/LPS O-acetylase OafA/YrhL